MSVHSVCTEGWGQGMPGVSRCRLWCVAILRRGQSTCLVGREGVTQEDSVYALDNVDISGRPLRFDMSERNQVNNNVGYDLKQCSIQGLCP